MSEQGRKYDSGKLRYDLIPVLALEETTKVVTKGAEKYDDENWKLVPEGRRRYLAAAMRHIQQWRKGVIYDEEMGTHHIANAISNLMFILEKELQGWEDTSETSEIVKAEKVIVMPLHYQNPDNEEDRKVRDFYVDRVKGTGVVVAFGSKENIYKESESEDQGDISQDVLKEYMESQVLEFLSEDKYIQAGTGLWYPPVEDGGNPWIEYDGSGQPVEDSVLVETLFSDERIDRKYVDYIAPAGDYLWEDSCLVAYRVV